MPSSAIAPAASAFTVSDADKPEFASRASRFPALLLDRAMRVSQVLPSSGLVSFQSQMCVS